jgi:hypothetical protein
MDLLASILASENKSAELEALALRLIHYSDISSDGGIAMVVMGYH